MKDPKSITTDHLLTEEVQKKLNVIKSGKTAFTNKLAMKVPMISTADEKVLERHQVQKWNMTSIERVESIRKIVMRATEEEDQAQEGDHLMTAMTYMKSVQSGDLAEAVLKDNTQ